ncbi:hypothetical protein ACIF8W_11840 [Streptomyces sp. NPDC085639]|uniref:hypothetical protein n=1 Tax=Streptomyces sp. NPDC085639 TaxID=3365734 RepID=UPI0037CD1EE7
MGIFNRRRRQREAAEDAEWSARLDVVIAHAEAGRHFIAPATAHQMFASPPQIQGFAEYLDGVLSFKAQGALSSAEAWKCQASQINAVRDGDSPGEIMITFHPGSPFLAIVVTPDRHEDKWRALSPADGQTPTS